MDKYYVLVEVIKKSYEQIEIEAESEIEAHSKAKKTVNKGCYSYFEVGNEKTIKVMNVTKAE